MGCCMSTDKDSPQKHHQFPESNSKAPPPSFEEETVKEVLSVSETPTAKPGFREIEEEKKTPELVFQEIEEETTTTLPDFPKIEEEQLERKAPVFIAEEISEVSEICSLSESVSVSTTAITDRREDEEWSRDDGEVRQRVNRSPAKIPRKRLSPGKFTGRTERGGKSPVKKSEPSPSRRNDNAVKSVHSREVTQATRRRLLGTNGPKRDSGESSGRRSRSPAARTNNVAPTRSGLGRSPSARRTGQSPGRNPYVENGRKPEEEAKEENFPATSESLENPLVSMECFIFL